MIQLTFVITKKGCLLEGIINPTKMIVSKKGVDIKLLGKKFS